MNTFTLLIQTLIGLSMLVRGGRKLIGVERVRAQFSDMRLGRGVRWLVGGLELLGGIGMLLAIAQPFLVFFVSVFLLLVLGASLLLQLSRKFRKGIAMTAALLAGVVVAGAAQPLGLQVLALPKAEALPLDLVKSARLVKTYDEGLWFESVKVGPDGTIYLAANKGENYATGDKSQAHARIIARAADGSERTFFELPQGSTAGVIAFGADGQMYMTGQGEQLGVWRVSPNGQGNLFAKLPRGAWPNGITVGPDGQLYVADSLLGLIWKINPATGEVERAIESDLLRRRKMIALAPGANGIHFFGRDLYVTVSDRAQILKFNLSADGKLGTPTVFASGIPGDDFAIDKEGSLYVTTHPFNTIVRVKQDGTRNIVADASHGIIGATDAAFGVLPGDENTLYVATDGGAFSGEANARGTVVALKIGNTK